MLYFKEFKYLYFSVMSEQNSLLENVTPLKNKYSSKNSRMI